MQLLSNGIMLMLLSNLSFVFEVQRWLALGLNHGAFSVLLFSFVLYFVICQSILIFFSFFQVKVVLEKQNQLNMFYGV